MATMLEEYTTEKQRSVMCFCVQNDSMQRIFIEKCFLFTVGSVFLGNDDVLPIHLVEIVTEATVQWVEELI
jgi:hypothetical protein